MAEYIVKLPPLGEGAPNEATVSFFLVSEGDEIKKDEDFCEMLTDKATFMVPCPVSGRVKQIVAKEDELVSVGGTLAILEVA